MNHSSERQSPGGSTALWCHCSRRCVLVKVPSFSVCAAAGRKKTSVRDVLGAQLAGLDLRAVVPERGGLDLLEVAHDQPVELAPAPCRWSRAFAEPTAGFSPSTKKPFTSPSRMSEHRRVGASGRR